MSNDKLIGEARAHVAAMADAAPPNSRARILAGEVGDERTALLIRLTNALEGAEKAHTSASDEREALAQAIRDALGVTPETIAAGHQRPGNTDDLARDLIARGFGFRRSEAPEPSAESEPSDAQMNRDHLAHVIHKAVYSRIPLDRLTDEAQADTYKRADAVLAALRTAGGVR